MTCAVQWVASFSGGFRGRRYNFLDAERRYRGDAGRGGFVAEQTVHAFVAEPPPNARLRFVRRWHYCACSEPIGGQKHDTASPDVVLRSVSIIENGSSRRRSEAETVIVIPVRMPNPGI